MVLDGMFMDKDLSKLQGGDGLDEYSRALMEDGAAAAVVSEVIPETPPSEDAPATGTDPVQVSTEGGESTDNGQTDNPEVVTDPVPEVLDPEIDAIFEALFGTTDDADASTKSLGDMIKESGNEQLISAFDKMQEDMVLKDKAIADLKDAREQDASAALIQDGELSKLNRVVSVVAGDDTLKQIVGYMSQYKDKPDLSPKLQNAIEELYEKVAGVKISDLKAQAESNMRQGLSSPAPQAAAPNIQPKETSGLDEYSRAIAGQ